MLARKLPSVEHLRLSGGTTGARCAAGAKSLPDPQLHRTYFPALSGLVSLKTMKLDCVVFPSLATILRICAALPNLATLECHTVEWSASSASAQYVPVRPPSLLTLYMFSATIPSLIMFGHLLA
ncbi:uncharacterized protein B0H18DRAFT_1171554 [Fomitopsis serialis]|uniref:uncharacterized protein n=1 Tax=Fomitopsis serialis TaxID=139415 RepID=UPI0020075B69|nr:uncharacterized protein B0H18DRAFT_1172506 [Neoantrodia serialis]XP_047892920.1 uncharacterized protein B0H18DRAFT_1171554 [Neoantrodia serialis]KAH9910891.1 hypothetical protein B0H18DRAFT_1172506 [Neoantrodia serialis]KAH9925159.1 hypothetical protein B0H18DRAFT_1171554 [Neoantrodia serialis]